MEYVPLDPLVQKAIEGIEERVGGSLRCPMCDFAEWSALHNRFLRLHTPLDMSEAEIDAASDTDLYANFRALALICERCEFVALHAIPEDAEGT
ncbi:MAG: hypothetical protein ACRDPV_02040 [Gaiellaceae bacterium]